MNDFDNLAIETLRVTSATMITKAKSGHTGICLDIAPTLHVLFTRFLNLYSASSKWINRDRFILSAGHGSALLYTLLHLSGFNISVDDLKKFRQKNSITCGHPEYGITDGVEITTGPLGQGLASAVGFAIAGKNLASRYNKTDATLFNYKNYVLCGDGDLQEGIAMEACSLAGHLKLNNLVLIFDSNDIQLDGATNMACSDNIEMKFKAMNWDYLKVEDGNDITAIEKALVMANNNLKPTIIEVKTIIGYGAYNEGTSSIHGKPLNDEQLNLLKERFNFSYKDYEIPKEVYELYGNTLIKRGKETYDYYLQTLAYYKEHYPNEYNELMNLDKCNLDVQLPTYNDKISTRKVAGQVLNKLGEANKYLICGSADLASSCMIVGNDGDFEASNYSGRNIHYGVREHAMGAIVNGLTLSNLIGVASGFFVFSDYMKDTIRAAAIMKIPSLFIFSHDSVCVGEDGPTHQPIEQLTGLRAMPNLNVVRPADAKETTYAISAAIKHNDYPTVIVTSRQDVPVLQETSLEGFNHGAYIAYEPNKNPNYILISCGTDLSLCLEAAKELENEGLMTRVVSMPSQFIFNKQDEAYKEQILPANITKRLAVEMGSTLSWYRYANNVLGIDRFGSSMPLKEIYEYYGFTVTNIKKLIKEME